MKSKYIALLSKQIEKLDQPNFDLEAWKTGATAVLQRVFGIADARAKQIEQLKIDYSSWMLRDSNSNYKPIETAKLKGSELIKSAIEEVEIFGVPEDQNTAMLGADFAKDLQRMTPKEKAKHFQQMKKDKLVALLVKLTS
ncbi:MAG: hypothetical protein AAF616_04020 [Bacteroidota bacterium]